MSMKEKPLPKPPKTPFGRKRPEEREHESGNLIADRMAAAMAEGKLEDFLKQEMPDNEYARNLASMMMGMTGMLPSGGEPSGHQAPGQKEGAPAVNTAPVQTPSAEDVPEDVKKAVQSGDMQGLMEMLRREHRKRMPEAEPGGAETPEAPPSQTSTPPAIDKDLIDELIKIATDNSVSLDWMILRAIKVYVQEYRKTGRL
jgi:hypothetical protein